MASLPLNAYWPLGDTGADLSGKGNPATFTGTTTTKQRGPFANKGSRHFSTTSTDYAELGTSVRWAERGTFSFWIKWINRQMGDDGSYAHNIYSRRDAAGLVNGGGNIYFVDNRGSSENITLGFRDSTTGYAKRSPSLAGLITDDVWYHFACVYDFKTTGNTAWYLNGKKLPGMAIDGVTTESWSETCAANNRIGYSANAGSAFSGYLSEFAILGFQLSSQQIREYYNSCIGRSSTARVPLSIPPVSGGSRTVGEAATAVDTISANLSTFWISEVAAAADAVEARNQSTHPVAQETATALDALTAHLVTKNVHLTETAIAADAISARVSTFWPVINEVATAADSVSKNVEVSKIVDEVATASDAVIGVIPKWLELSETATAADALAFDHTYVSSPKAGNYNLYLDGFIRTTLLLKYRQDYDCTEKVFGTPSRLAYTIWQTLRLSYRQYYGMEMLHIPAYARQNYDLASTAIFRRNWNGGLQAFTYSIREQFNFQSRQFSNITERTRVDLRQRVYYSARLNDDYSENMSFVYRVMLDGLDYTDKVKSLSYNYSLSQYTGECSITWLDPQMYAQLDPLTRMGTTRLEVYTGHYGMPEVLQGRFLIEKRSTEIDASKAYPTTWGRTVTARLAAPHSLPITKTWMYDTKALTIALEIMQLSDPNIQLNWQVTDYDVLGGNFVAAGDEPISLLTKLAEPLGAIVTTNKQGQIVVRYQYV